MAHGSHDRSDAADRRTPSLARSFWLGGVLGTYAIWSLAAVSMVGPNAKLEPALGFSAACLWVVYWTVAVWRCGQTGRHGRFWGLAARGVMVALTGVAHVQALQLWLAWLGH